MNYSAMQWLAHPSALHFVITLKNWSVHCLAESPCAGIKNTRVVQRMGGGVEALSCPSYWIWYWKLAPTIFSFPILPHAPVFILVFWWKTAPPPSLWHFFDTTAHRRIPGKLYECGRIVHEWCFVKAKFAHVGLLAFVHNFGGCNFEGCFFWK